MTGAITREKVISTTFILCYRTEIKNQIQNDSPKFGLIAAISNSSVELDTTTHQ
jgi:hypothetical protein